MPSKLSSAERAAIAAFYKTRLPILCAPGSCALDSLSICDGVATYKPILYFGRSANRQRIIASNLRAIPATIAQANRVIYLGAE